MVAGGAAGIGLACVKALSQAGCTTMAVDIDEQALRWNLECLPLHDPLHVYAVAAQPMCHRADIQKLPRAC